MELEKCNKPDDQEPSRRKLPGTNQPFHQALRLASQVREVDQGEPETVENKL